MVGHGGQVGQDQIGRHVISPILTAVAALHQDRVDAHALPGQDIARRISHQNAFVYREVELLERLLDHAGRGFAAAAGGAVGRIGCDIGEPRVVRTIIDAVQSGLGRLPQQGLQMAMDRLQLGFGAEVARHDRLIGDHQDQEAVTVEARDRRRRPGDEPQLIGAAQQVDLFIDHAIAIKQDSPQHELFRRRDR